MITPNEIDFMYLEVALNRSNNCEQFSTEESVAINESLCRIDTMLDESEDFLNDPQNKLFD